MVLVVKSETKIAVVNMTIYAIYPPISKKKLS